ncbi:MAG: serine hydrolase domain-containing protein [Parvularculaceae bacterium]|nr:serine hydrolase domain-containing protein [Parvularculaceae bacterium]
MKEAAACLLVALSVTACAKSRLLPPPPKSYYVDGAPVSAVLQNSPDFSGVVMVGEKGETLFATAQGLADRQSNRTLSLYDSWRWASVTKMVTAILVLQEVEKGRLTLDKTLADQAPEFTAEPAGKATIRQLLQHTSGIANPDRGATDGVGFPLVFSADASVRADPRATCAAPANAAPGERFDYNNCDYLVLGRLLEIKTGESLQALFRKRIAEPAGMRGADWQPGACEESVKGYAGATESEPPVNVAAFGAAGALCGPPRALQAFAAAAMSGKLISEPMRAEMRKSDPKYGYAGLGVWSYEAPLEGCNAPLQLVERRGGIGGIEVRLLLAPSLGRSLTIFSNRADVPLGEVWTRDGLNYALAGAAFCRI